MHSAIGTTKEKIGTAASAIYRYANTSSRGTGYAVGFGRNTEGQLGTGSDDTVDKLGPIDVPMFVDFPVVHAATGDNFSVFVASQVRQKRAARTLWLHDSKHRCALSGGFVVDQCVRLRFQ
jgi:hypothetical protein